MKVRPAPALVELLLRLSLGLSLFMAAAPAQAAPRVYTLDPAHSRLTIHVGKAGLFGFAGHEHEIVAGAFRGSATFDPDRLAQSSVDLTFDAGALRVSGQGEPPEDVPQVQTAMVGATCLDVARFPTIRFVSTSVAAAGAAGPNGGDLALRGELTLHGVTRPLTLRVHLDVTGQTLEATGQTTLHQTDFGITPISKAGVVKVKDELTLSWRIRGRAP
ncbi:MAG TPA: YceI family protein [Polyangia bacterium]|nr:YceI family protein [Polyangia bacterium]